MGVMEDKVIKNHYAAEYIYNKYKETKTCGVVEEDESAGIMKVAEPIGVIYSRWAGFSWPDRSRRAISQAADSTHAPDPPKASQNAYGESASSR